MKSFWMSGKNCSPGGFCWFPKIFNPVSAVPSLSASMAGVACHDRWWKAMTLIIGTSQLGWPIAASSFSLRTISIEAKTATAGLAGKPMG